MGEGVDDFLHDFGVFGLLDFLGRAGVTGGEVDGEMLQGGSVSEGKITSNTAGVDRFFAVF